MAERLRELSQVIGQSKIISWFQSCIERDKLPQVIMLTGPAGVGKTTIAEIVACEIACRNAPEKLAATKESVIGQQKSTDAVRIYNMSNLRSQEAVAEVKSDLNIGFSSTGRKVIIMDEAHGMSDEAQDSLLVQFESLPSHVYILVCSTEVTSFRDAFLSRCVPRKLSALSQTEMKTLLRRRIEENRLRFELSLPIVYALISNYAGREPRRALNLLDSFEEGSMVTTDELETFFNVYESKQVLTLIRYLYFGEILLGLEFINEMDITNTLPNTLLELLRVAQGGTAATLQKDGVDYIRDLVASNGINMLLGFAIDVTTSKSRLTYNTLSGYFLKWCSKNDFLKEPPKSIDKEKVHVEDISVMSRMIENPKLGTLDNRASSMTLDELFADSETIE